MIEIERKFLVTGAFKHLATNVTHIEQGYFATEPGKTVRVRIRGDKGYLTIKGPSDAAGIGRYEFETEVPLDDAHHLMKLCRPGVIIKDRYLVPNGKHTVEVDEFFGDNAGLIMAEIELSAPDEPYIRPDFLGKEVTGDHRFYNKYMLSHPYCEWKNEIEK